MKKIFKFLLKASLISLIMAMFMTASFGAGFTLRPDFYDSLPPKVQDFIGPEKSHVSTSKLTTAYDNRILVGVFDSGLKDIAPGDIKTLMRSDLNWVIDVYFNRELRAVSPVNGEINWYQTVSNSNEPRKDSESYIDDRGAPITVLTFILPEGDLAWVVEIKLFGSEDYKVNVMQKESKFIPTPKNPEDKDEDKNDPGKSEENEDEF